MKSPRRAPSDRSLRLVGGAANLTDVYLRTACFAFVLGLIPGCSSTSVSPDSGTCTPGSTQSCVGPAGCEGGQECNADGTGYDACVCEGGSGASGGQGGSAGQGGSSGGGQGGSLSAGGTTSGGAGAGATSGSGGSAGSGGSPGSGGSGGSPAGGSAGMGGAPTGGSGGTVSGGAAGTGATGGSAGMSSGGTAGAGGTAGGGAGGTSGAGSIVYEVQGQSCVGIGQCQTDSCCETLEVAGGTFPMGRSDSGSDAFANGEAMEQSEHNVTVSTFHLEKYEVTVGRFRKFVEVYDGTPPPPGSGAHPLYAETGWQAAWNMDLPSNALDLVESLKCNFDTWTDAPSGNEEKAINCVSWLEAFAFCIWDGARLPTEAEWEYAAAGGIENRLYAWGADTPTCNHANFTGCGNAVAEVGAAPLGAGYYGHFDLSGNLYEWIFDWHSSAWYDGPGNTCVDCVNNDPTFTRGRRGGAFNHDSSSARAAFRAHSPPDSRAFNIGFRCARSQ